ncbi:MAG: hypothetical protein NTZ90_15890 [Proteobacteria bacterium]|nr:hypothetical protein [Pseudomonadota bacterium]
MTDWNAHVHPHSDLVEMQRNLWQVTGRLPRGNIPRNMVVYRLPQSGGLLIHSAVALDDQRIKKLEALGQPEILIVPNRMHRLDAAVYKERYPKIRVLCPAAAREHVAKIVAVDASCEDVLPTYGIQIHAPRGIRPGELCYELPVPDGGVLVVTDLLFNLDHQPGLDGFIFRVIGSSGFFGITGIGRLLMLQDRLAFREWLLLMAQRTDLKAICVAHGGAITSDVANALKAAAERLK